MRKVTLCFLVNGDNICLAMKKRGFGVGKWNGVGGKVEDGETIVAAALRELKEEIRVDANEEDVEEMGNLKFYFNGKPEWSQQMHIFFINKWNGTPVESEEMAPEWYSKSKLPFHKMWVDDPHWLPKVIDNKKIQGEFHFSSDGSVIEKFKVREI